MSSQRFLFWWKANEQRRCVLTVPSLYNGSQLLRVNRSEIFENTRWSNAPFKRDTDRAQPCTFLNVQIQGTSQLRRPRWGTSRHWNCGRIRNQVCYPGWICNSLCPMRCSNRDAIAQAFFHDEHLMLLCAPCLMYFDVTISPKVTCWAFEPISVGWLSFSAQIRVVYPKSKMCRRRGWGNYRIPRAQGIWYCWLRYKVSCSSLFEKILMCCSLITVVCLRRVSTALSRVYKYIFNVNVIFPYTSYVLIPSFPFISSQRATQSNH